MQLYDAVAESSDPVLRARGAIGYADASWRPGGVRHETVVKLVSAIAYLPEGGDARLRLEAQANLSRALGYAGEHRAAESLAREVIAGARRMGDERLLAAALLAPSATTPDVDDQLLARVNEASAIISLLDDPDLVAQAAFVRGTTCYIAGDRKGWTDAVDHTAPPPPVCGRPL